MGNGDGHSALEDRLDDAAEAIEAAETETDLDDAETRLEGIESDLEDVTAEDTTDERHEQLETRIEELREEVDSLRGPYAEDVVEHLESAETSVASNTWTAEGETTVTAAVGTLLGTAEEHLPGEFALEATDPEGLAERLSAVATTIESAQLDPDEDDVAIEALLGTAEELESTVEDAQVFGDLEKREQLRRRGFYDVLEPANRKDFPPEWNAIKLYEARGEVEPILLAMETFDSEFMQDNALDALEHLGDPAAFETVHGLAQRREIQAIRILGRMGDERACETLEEFLGGGSVELRTTALWALGCIGSEESAEPVAQELAAEDPEIRSAAARALGLLGDTRAIEPLAERLDADDDERVRASAAWALVQVGTRRALETVAAYADDRSYLVQAEARKATGV
jgi:ElaB/YqjD/DUF883 family membrane-anchored ribosome-binding protein